MANNNYREPNKYTEKTFSEKRIKLTYVPIDGLGIGGSYYVEAKISVQRYQNVWRLFISATTAIHAKYRGEITPSSFAILHTENGQDRRPLSNNGKKMSITDANFDLGGCVFVLPQYGPVEIELEVGYHIQTETTSWNVGNSIADWTYENVSKSIGKFLGKIREKIY